MISWASAAISWRRSIVIWLPPSNCTVDVPVDDDDGDDGDGDGDVVDDHFFSADDYDDPDYGYNFMLIKKAMMIIICADW